MVTTYQVEWTVDKGKGPGPVDSSTIGQLIQSKGKPVMSPESVHAFTVALLCVTYTMLYTCMLHWENSML